MSGVFYLCDVLKFIIHGLYKCSLSQADLISHTHERVSHIVLDFCDELYSIYKETFKKSFSDISFITKEFSLATDFFKKLNYGDGFILDITTDFSDYTYDKLKDYQVVVMLNASPNTPQSRRAFEEYMENGGGWMGFHAAAYNDKNTRWPWFVRFLGGGVFLCNNWPPQPVLVEADTQAHPVTQNLP